MFDLIMIYFMARIRRALIDPLFFLHQINSYTTRFTTANLIRHPFRQVSLIKKQAQNKCLGPAS